MASLKSNMGVVDYSSSDSDSESNMASPKSIMGVGESPSSASVLEGNKVQAPKLPYLSMEQVTENMKAEKYTGFIDHRPFVPPRNGFVWGPQQTSHKRKRDGSDLTVKSDGTRPQRYVCEYHKSLPSVPKDSKMKISGPGPIPFLPKDSKGYTIDESMKLLDILKERRRFRETCGCDTFIRFYPWNV